MKTCTKCKTEKDFGEFNKCSSKKDGLLFWCKCCIHDYKKLRRNGPEREVVLAKDKQYHETRKEKSKPVTRVYKKKYYETKRDEILKKVSEYRQTKMTQHQKDSARLRNAKRAEQYRQDIDARYAANLIASRSIVFTTATVPKELVQLKQAHLKLTRLIKEIQ